MPPPTPSLTRFPTTVEFWTARVPWLWMPPPRAPAVFPSTIVLKRLRMPWAATNAPPPVVAEPPVMVTPATIELAPAGTSKTRLPRPSMIVVRAPAPWPPDRPAPMISTSRRTSGPWLSR